MNNVTSIDIIKARHSEESCTRRNRLIVLDYLSDFDEPVRPWQLEKIDLGEATINKHLNYWDKQGRVKRTLKDGLIWWEYLEPEHD